MKKLYFMIQTASLIGLIKTLLILLLIYTLFKYIIRLFAPFIISSLVRNISRKFDQNQSDSIQYDEGEVSIDKSITKNKSNNDLGDYVDYEEID